MADDETLSASETTKRRRAPMQGAGSKLWLLVMVGVVLIGSGGGFATGWMLVHSAPPPGQAPPPGRPPPEDAPAPVPDQPGELRYFDFEPITVNINEPRLARYIRATITVAFRAEDYGRGKSMVERKLPELRNLLTVYLASLTLEEIRGEKNLNRIRREIRNKLNEHLWPEQKPLIETIFLKEFAVQ